MDRLQRIRAAGVLRVGTTMDTPAFSMRDRATRRLFGFDMDMLAALEPALGVAVQYVEMKFGTMLDDLGADRFDIAMSGMGRTTERARVAAFSRPYMTYGKLLSIRAEDDGKWQSLAEIDQAGRRIAYNRGGLNDHFAHTMFSQATPVGYPDNEQATADLLAGKVDAQVSDSTAAIYRAKTDRSLSVLAPARVFNPVHVAILLRQADITLLNFINIWLDQMELDGTLARIKETWLGVPSSDRSSVAV